ncbi:MAG: signal peptidase I [Oscillospiraceae bacterium]|nr:signal peptidase I [Oscillospiraceae bacterium]
MKKVLKSIVNILAWVVLILALLVTILVFSSARNNGVANLFGYIPLTVESDSMYPTFKQGDLIICREIDSIDALQENDVITFWTIIDGKRVKNTHRITAVNDEDSVRSFITRGDNNAIDDDTPTYAGDIIGKWTNVKLAGLGNVMAFLRTKTGFFVCILIPMAIFFLFELYKFIVVLIEIKQPAAPEIDEEEIKRRAIEEYLAEQQKKNDAAPADSAEAQTEEKVTVPADTAEAPADDPSQE